MKKYLGIDLSLAKSGIAVIRVKDSKPHIELAYLIKTNPDQEIYQRIDHTVTEIKFLANRYGVEAITKEASVVGRASTATNVIKTHGVYEHELSGKYELDDIHGASIKAWSRKIIGKERAKQLKADEPKKHNKLIVKEAVEKYYGEVPELHTPRGAYIDDIGDAIALMTLWLEKQKIIPEVNRFEE